MGTKAQIDHTFRQSHGSENLVYISRWINASSRGSYDLYTVILVQPGPPDDGMSN